MEGRKCRIRGRSETVMQEQPTSASPVYCPSENTLCWAEMTRPSYCSVSTNHHMRAAPGTGRPWAKHPLPLRQTTTKLAAGAVCPLCSPQLGGNPSLGAGRHITLFTKVHPLGGLDPLLHICLGGRSSRVPWASLRKRKSVDNSRSQMNHIHHVIDSCWANPTF